MKIDVDVVDGEKEDLTGVSTEDLLEREFPGFKYRKFQKEAIISIIDAYRKNPNVTIMVNAPTGSGKSIIAMICSTIFEKCLDKRGYIITSDTYLQDQYENDIFKLDLDIPSIKGRDRYTCNENDEIISLGICHQKGMGSKDRRELACYSSCEYYSKQNSALVSGVSVLNYHYWIIYQHLNEQLGKTVKFSKRDFVFFDEAHKCVNIANEYFATVLTKYSIYSIKSFMEFMVAKISTVTQEDAEGYMDSIEGIYEDILTETGKDFDNLKTLLQALNYPLTLKGDLNKINAADEIEEYNPVTQKTIKNLPKANKKALANYNKIKSLYGKIENYISLIEDDPDGLLIRDGDIQQKKVTYYCRDVSRIMAKYFHKFYKGGIFMSATFLNIPFFAHYASMEDVAVINIPNTFDFSKSPIYYSTQYNMSYHKKKHNIGPQVEKIDEIVEKHQSGIIHTGSYENALFLRNNTKHSNKIQVYKNTDEKKELVRDLIKNRDFFIAGPSLLEGIDLKDDISRCQIFMKIPYLNLGSTFVKERFKQNENWYVWETTLNFVQGLGRSNRSKDDYCVTYILDSSFSRLLQSRMVPPFIEERLEMIDD